MTKHRSRVIALVLALVVGLGVLVWMLNRPATDHWSDNGKYVVGEDIIAGGYHAQPNWRDAALCEYTLWSSYGSKIVTVRSTSVVLKDGQTISSDWCGEWVRN